MACDRWNEQLVAALYDELEEGDRRSLDEHLAGCDACRREMEELTGARRSLQAAEPRVPYAPHVVVLDSPRRTVRSWWSFAAGFACAALLLGAGLVAGLQIAGAGGDGPIADIGEGEKVIISGDDPGMANLQAVPAGYVSRDEFDAALMAQEERFRDLLAERSGQLLTSDLLDSRLTQFSTNFDQKRRNDLRFLLQEILAAEVRSGTAIDETQQAVRYLAVANHPGLSEW